MVACLREHVKVKYSLWVVNLNHLKFKCAVFENVLLFYQPKKAGINLRASLLALLKLSFKFETSEVLYMLVSKFKRRSEFLCAKSGF